MNTDNPIITEAEMHASGLQSFGGQKHKTEAYAKARELRRWIAANPGKLSTEMPQELRGYVTFLQRKKLITFKGRPARWFVKPQ